MNKSIRLFKFFRIFKILFLLSLVAKGQTPIPDSPTPASNYPEYNYPMGINNAGDLIDFMEDDIDSPLFRADFRSPAVIRANGGFRSHANSAATPQEQWIFSIFAHANNSFQMGNQTPYISFTQSINSARQFVSYNFAGDYHDGQNDQYIYVVNAPFDFALSVNEILGDHVPNRSENEIVVLDTLPWHRIYGWFHYPRNQVNNRPYLIRNPDYEEDGYPNGIPPPDFLMAGFPVGHPAWSESPWQEVAPDDCK